MYESFYNLSENPFSYSPNPKYLYLTENHREALAVLYYGIKQRKGFVAITGEVGTGKTTLINSVLEQVNTQVVLSANIFNPILGRREFFETIMAEFGLSTELKSKSQFLRILNELLVERYRKRLITLLIIDEAQNLSNALLEEVRLLTNLETSDEKLLQIILVGQLEFWEKLKRPELKQLRQRINLYFRLVPLSAGDVGNYIRQRLRIAGAVDLNLFSDDAIKAIAEYSGGIPRLINKICDGALTLGYTYNRSMIFNDVIEEVSKDFELEKVSAGMASGNGKIPPQPLTNDSTASKDEERASRPPDIDGPRTIQSTILTETGIPEQDPILSNAHTYPGVALPESNPQTLSAGETITETSSPPLYDLTGGGSGASIENNTEDELSSQQTPYQSHRVPREAPSGSAKKAEVATPDSKKENLVLNQEIGMSKDTIDSADKKMEASELPAEIELPEVTENEIPQATFHSETEPAETTASSDKVQPALDQESTPPVLGSFVRQPFNRTTSEGEVAVPDNETEDPSLNQQAEEEVTSVRSSATPFPLAEQSASSSERSVNDLPSRGLLSELMKIPGVKGVIMTTRDGSPLSDSGLHDAESTAVQATCLIRIDQEVELSIGIWDLFVRCMASYENNKLMLRVKDNAMIAAFLERSIDQDACTSEIYSVLQKYLR